MRSIDAYEAVKTALQELCTEESYYFVEPIVEDGQSIRLFPMITMENTSSAMEHNERGRAENIEILTMFAVRGTKNNIVELLNDVESKIKRKLYADRTLADNVKFFDFSVLNRDYTSGQGGVCVGWGEGALRGQTV